MSDLIRDAPLGQIIRFITKNRVLQYPEERPDFQCPGCYTSPGEAPKAQPVLPDLPNVQKPDPEKPLDTPATERSLDFEKPQLPRSTTARTASTFRSGLERVPTRSALQRAHTQADLEEQFSVAALEKGPSMPVAPARLDDGTVLVDWYTTDDPANPQNWSFGKKGFVATQIYLYTLAVYMGSAIYAPSTAGIMTQFGVGPNTASLGLSMYVLAYGMGPMLWSPLSEIPVVGRNPPYMSTFFIFVILLLPSALVDNFAGLIVLRFLQGFFGSPCLATGGASLQDMYSLIKLPYVLSLWALAATCGPSLGPIISGFSVAAENWRWSMWEMLWLSGPVWVLLFLCLPETSTSNILLRRAARLRKITGDERLRSQSEIDQGKLTLRDVAVESLWRPVQMMLLDPAIAFTAVYTALVYAIYYSFFEVFPEVYIGMYGFNLGEMGLTFLSITVGVLLGIASYWSYVYWIVEPEIRTHGLGAPERRLIPALFVAFFCPIGLFMFGWTANPDIHWIVSVIGVMIFTIGIFLLIQCIFLYLPLTYPQYAASLFAGNDFTRSTLAAGAIHFSRPLYLNLGVGPGVSLLAAFTCACVAGIYVLYFFGDKLRARSRFAAK